MKNEEKKRSPRIDELVAKAMDGTGYELLLRNDSLKVFPTRYGKGSTYAGSYYDVNSNKRKQFYSKESDKEKAKKAFRKFLLQKVIDRCKVLGKIDGDYLLSHLMNDFLHGRRDVERSTNTLAEYRHSFRVLLNAFGDKPIDSLTIRDAQSFLKDGTQLHSVRFDRITKGTLWKHIRNYKALWNYGCSHHGEHVHSNIWCKLLKPIEPQVVKSAPTLIDFQKVEERVHMRYSGYRGRRLIRYIKILAMTAMRTNECLSMLTSWIDEPDCCIRIRTTSVRPIKHQTERVIPLNNELLSIIKDQLSDNEGRGIRSDIIFPNDDGTYLSDDTIRPHLKEVLGGFENMTWKQAFHAVRRFWGRLMYANGIPMETIQQQYGHKDIKTTREYLGIDATPTPGQRKALELTTGIFRRDTKLGYIPPTDSNGVIAFLKDNLLTTEQKQ